MALVVGFGHHAGVRVAEVGLLLVLIAGVSLALPGIPQFKSGVGRTQVAGVLLVIGSLLLLVATHWGRFG